MNKMEKNEILGILQKSIQETIIKDNDYELGYDEPLISSGVIDSFSLVDLALMIEDKFGVKIEDYELNSDAFDTLVQLTDIILTRLN